MSKQKPTDIVYTPQQVSTLATAVIQERRATPGAGVRMGIKALDADLLPLRPSELCAVIGRPSNYKSGLMLYTARQQTKKILSAKKEQECVIYVTWEVAVEESGIMELANATQIGADAIAQGNVTDAQWKKLLAAAVQRAVTPLWVVGHSIANRKRRPRMTMTDVATSLQFIEDEMGFHPSLIVLDYLQQMQPEGEVADRRLQMIENVHRAKDMALAMGCPVLMGVQAGRQVDGRQFKLPLMGDGMETSNIEHTADKVLGVWMPKTSEPAGSMVGNPPTPVTDNLLVIGLSKQRFGPAGKIYYCHVKPEVNEIHGMETVKL